MCVLFVLYNNHKSINHMKVILLTGPSNTGKTTTLHELYNTLFPDGKSNNIEAPKPHPFDGRDYIYYVRYNSKKIGIVTLGDYAIETVFQIGVFLAKGADVLVIANSNKEFPETICKWHSAEYDGELERVVVDKLSINDQGKVQEIIVKL